MLAVGLAALAVAAALEGAADCGVHAICRRVANAVHAFNRRLHGVANRVLRAADTRGRDVIYGIEAFARNVTRCAEDAADRAVDSA